MPAATATPKAPPAPRAPAEPAPPPELDRAGAIEVARIMHMASEPTRLRILLLLAGESRNVGQLCLALGGIGRSACASHVGLLRNTMLISQNRVGQHVYYDLSDRGRRLVGAIRMVAGAGGGEG
jgi:DNA-binding transcriptional ArsR family regulator